MGTAIAPPSACQAPGNASPVQPPEEGCDLPFASLPKTRGLRVEFAIDELSESIRFLGPYQSFRDRVEAYRFEQGAAPFDPEPGVAIATPEVGRKPSGGASLDDPPQSKLDPQPIGSDLRSDAPTRNPNILDLSKDQPNQVVNRRLVADLRSASEVLAIG